MHVDVVLPVLYDFYVCTADIRVQGDDQAPETAWHNCVAYICTSTDTTTVPTIKVCTGVTSGTSSTVTANDIHLYSCRCGFVNQYFVATSVNVELYRVP